MPGLADGGYGRGVVSTWHRLRAAAREYPAVVDAAVATALLAAALVSLTGDLDSAPGVRSAEPVVYLLVALGIAPYYLRRRAPLAVLVVASVPVVTMIGLGYTPGVLGAGLFLACYTVAAWSSRRQLTVASLYTAMLLVGVAITWPDHLRPVQLVENLVLFATAFALGDAVRTRREAAESTAEKAALIEQHQAELARQAVTDERLKIARELHDLVAHSLGVIAVQAGVGAHVIDTQPVEAKRALEAIVTTSREALGEIRGLLGVLRSADGEASYEPPAGLADLDALVERTSAAGVPVTVGVEGQPVPLPLGIDLAAYRVIQEALTNVLRHAGDARAHVRLSYRPEQLGIEVTDDGRGANPATSGSRQGLLGMRERVTVWGGSLDSGPRPDGGFRVSVRIPVGGAT